MGIRTASTGTDPLEQRHAENGPGGRYQHHGTGRDQPQEKHDGGGGDADMLGPCSERCTSACPMPVSESMKARVGNQQTRCD